MTGMLIVALALTAGCSGDDGTSEDPTASETAEPSPSPSGDPTADPGIPSTTEATAVGGLSQVPDEITVEYLDRVMDEIDRVYAEAFQLAKDHGSATHPSVVESLSRVYDSGYAFRELTSFEEALGVDTLADPVGAPTSDVLDIVVTNDECVLLVAQHQLAPIFADPSSYEQRNPLYVKLEPADSTEFAPLPWRVHFAAFAPEPPPTTCAEAGPTITEGSA